MRYLLCTALCLLAALPAMAQLDDDNAGDWKVARLVDSDATGDYWRCEYESLMGDERFVVNMRQGCSPSVQWNPFTGQIRQGLQSLVLPVHPQMENPGR